MAAVPVAELPECEKQELLCTYAALILHEEKMSITNENIVKLIKKSNNTVLPYLPMLFEKALKGKDIEGLLSNLSVGGGAPAASAQVATETADDGKKDSKKEEKVEEEEEEDDLGFSLFG
ncbi:60S acidic ribosomal protein P1, putative [Plasmodium berghei]|uniref:60S acidic ribosomal protein P1, putative n=2 Tax=Plasmodium berghei TaxID=5821 RepID=A0A509AJ86_PLABA|nr:60S acidic ribosomal protein P1, putative [Plasmodium berghei ANKA]CXI47050.1 60S acidic ribosomal protein P1, putative [Plasmodium berghei]SCM22852.1 60S acidic ribosomal protein P1, putative [Plasmodium berghei]SCN25748.1 60S acidic ribosomal protein P1, putative [Plasmodium berghei]SCO60655.1 60S acidic ribosomal protein P1, putative [Plasmodium berghei]SCO62371.1 60S acidic ribosomal protein P1, putative [Plasmodium berghei]|eukprot:XP_034421788.1 60S acidic ribosomal protein P1, putative [Plasmodium berghei ANKA]